LADQRGRRKPSGNRAQAQLDGNTRKSGPVARAPTAGENVAVIGLGRFGGQVAESLLRLGHEVLGIDQDPHTVQFWADRLTHVVQTDSTDNESLQQLGLAEFGRAVVGIGSDLEASVLTVLTLVEVGVEEIWAKAISVKHGKILASVGADHVIYPEAAMGDRVAHLITTKMLDFTELDEGFAIAKTCLPAELTGQTIGQVAMAHRYGVTVVGIKSPTGEFLRPEPDTVLPGDAILIVAGATDQVQRFATET
jgi:trk system potassium uptake protein TrkA